MTTLNDADAALAALAAADTKLNEVSDRVLDTLAAQSPLPADLQLEFVAAVGAQDDAERAYLSAVDVLHGHVESASFRDHADNAIDLTGGQH